MAAILIKDGSEVLRIENPMRVRFMLKTDAVEIPVPGQSDPWIFQIGGVSKRLNIEWKEVASDLPSSVANLANNVLQGDILPRYVLTIEEWNLTKNCVVFDLEISQEGGEATTYSCRMSVAIGENI